MTVTNRPHRRARAGLATLLLAGLVAGALATAPPVAAQPATRSAATACGAERPAGSFGERVGISPGHAQVWRQYQAFFLRQPDEGGLAHWYAVRARGATLSDIAYSFSVSEEFRVRYGNLGDEAYVDLVYRNVLCRQPDASGRAYWVGQLRSGAVTRWDMVVNFAELREYLARTGTCHSIHVGETAASAHCYGQPLVPLGQADYARDGYRAADFTIGRVGGGTGVLRGVEVDITRNLLGTSRERCGVASINGIWVAEPGKDGPTPSINGLGLVDGVHVRGSSERLDRGVLGLRFDANPQQVARPDYQGFIHQFSSILFHSGVTVIESWHSIAEQDAAAQYPSSDGWVWTVSGMPFRINGQTNPRFDHDYANDPYTNQTRNHSILAFDAQTRTVLFGATSTLDTRDLVRWAEARGYEELVKFDGGASTEFNVGGHAVVAGTSRRIPLWFGVGC